MEFLIVLIVLALIWLALVWPILRVISLTKVLRDPDLRDRIRKSLDLRRAAIFVWLFGTSFFPLILIDESLLRIGMEPAAAGDQMQFATFYFFVTPISLVVWIVLMVASSNSDR